MYISLLCDLKSRLRGPPLVLFYFIFLVPFVCANTHNLDKTREFLHLQAAAVVSKTQNPQNSRFCVSQTGCSLSWSSGLKLSGVINEGIYCQDVYTNIFFIFYPFVLSGN